jgi:GNAT superfamily N-acetyltransferase
VNLEGPVSGVSEQCERVLRTLPGWFGIESSLVQYVRDTQTLPTFVARERDAVVGFLTLREHFHEAWEVHCIAVQASDRRHGVGRALHSHVESWLGSRGVRLLQVKTMAESCPSPEYAETRRFYASIGYTPLETFPTLWGPKLPVLQLVKVVR